MKDEWIFVQLLKYSFYSNVYKQDFTPLHFDASSPHGAKLQSHPACTQRPHISNFITLSSGCTIHWQTLNVIQDSHEQTRRWRGITFRLVLVLTHCVELHLTDWLSLVHLYCITYNASGKVMHKLTQNLAKWMRWRSNITVHDWRSKTGFSAAVLPNVDRSAWNSAGICCCAEYTRGFNLIRSVHEQLQAKSKRLWQKCTITAYITDFHDLGRKPIDVWVADFAVMKHSGSF